MAKVRRAGVLIAQAAGFAMFGGGICAGIGYSLGGGVVGLVIGAIVGTGVGLALSVQDES